MKEALSDRKEADRFSKTRVLKRVCLEKCEEGMEEAGPDLDWALGWLLGSMLTVVWSHQERGDMV